MSYSITNNTGQSLDLGDRIITAGQTVTGLTFVTTRARNYAANGQLSITGDPTDTLPSPAGGTSIITLGRNGILSTGVGTMRFVAPRAMTIVGVRIACGTAPTGASIIVDVNKNGTTVFTTQANRPTIAAAANDSGAKKVPDVTALAAGDYLTFDLDQVGSTVTGADLSVSIEAS